MANYLDSRQSLDAPKVKAILASVLSGMSITGAAKAHNVSQGHVSAILYLRQWKHLIHTPETAALWRQWLENAIKRKDQDKEFILRQFDKNIQIGVWNPLEGSSG